LTKSATPGDRINMAELDDPLRLAQFRASIMQLDDDGVLQQCVERAAERAQAPMALVTFVMSKIQLFRAAVGLPPELAATRATSRCDSFCQFVVLGEKPFIVTNAKSDARVPQAMVETYGLAAYLGVPIQVGGQVLGSLCVADGVERQWRPELVDELSALADRVSARLQDLAGSERIGSVPPPAASNGLAAEVALLAQVVQRSLVEVGPMVRLANGMSRGIAPEALLRAGKVLSQASDFYDDMLGLVGELCLTSARLERSLTTPIPPERRAHPG